MTLMTTAAMTIGGDKIVRIMTIVEGEPARKSNSNTWTRPHKHTHTHAFSQGRKQLDVTHISNDGDDLGNAVPTGLILSPRGL